MNFDCIKANMGVFSTTHLPWHCIVEPSSLIAVGCAVSLFFFFFQAEDGIRDDLVTGVQTCALPISRWSVALDGDHGRGRSQGARSGRGVPPGCGRRSHDHPGAPERCTARGGCGAGRSGGGRGGEKGRTRGAPDHLKQKKEKKKSSIQ